jgi:hypothetical protein
LQGKYKLIMQTDGSLVMYRSDGSVRFRMAKYGWIATMQPDGNFIEYSGGMSPIWSTNTAGNPGSSLAIQDDGNLVVYTPTGVPVWNIGGDNGWGNPTKTGEVVGRDLLVPGVSWVGHLGLWDGQRVVEAGPSGGGGNAIHLTSIDTFKNASSYWGVASPAIPTEWQQPWCYDTYCSGAASRITLIARDAIARRAYQVYLIGADYTLSTQALGSTPATTYYPASRGAYRCDTFVRSMLGASDNYDNYTVLNSTQAQWRANLDSLYSTEITPKSLFEKLKAFK